MRQTVKPEDDRMETIHVWMVRENYQTEPDEDEKPQRWPHIQLPAFNRDKLQQWIMGSLAIFLMAGFTLIPDAPAYTIKTLRIPLVALPVQTFTASATIVPTGVQQIPATTAHGTLTVYNGSIFVQELPASFIVTNSSSVEIVTDQAVTIPPANPPEEGEATVSAHAIVTGAAGNITAGSVRQQDGADISIKNLATFTGGADAYTKQFATDADVNNATIKARTLVEAQPIKGLLIQPCDERVSQQGQASVNVIRTCQTYTYTLPKGLHVISIGIVDHAVLVKYKMFVYTHA